jgi:hypothetical protein
MDTMTPLSSFPDKLWTVDEVAAYLNCTTRHLHNLLPAGLPHLYLGRLLSFDPEAAHRPDGGDTQPSDDAKTTDHRNVIGYSDWWKLPALLFMLRQRARVAFG